LIVVDGYDQFTWGDEGLTPWRVTFQQRAIPWPMGFHVMSSDSGVDLSPEYLQPDLRLPALVARASRVWFIGPTVGGYSTAAPKILWQNPIGTPTVRELEGQADVGPLGLQWIGQTFLEYSGTYAQLYVHQRRR
jgi:hypothetical protein